MEKRQPEQQQKQARHSITLFYRMQLQPVASSDAIYSVDSLQAAVCNQSSPLTVAPIETKETAPNPLKQVNQGSSVTPHEVDRTVQVSPRTAGSSWVFVYDTLNSEIKIRHYSPKTLKSYRSWTRHFQAFTKSKDYQELTQ